MEVSQVIDRTLCHETSNVRSQLNWTRSLGYPIVLDPVDLPEPTSLKPPPGEVDA